MDSATAVRSTLAPHESLPMFAVSDELAPRIAAMGLERNIKDMEERGFTMLDDVAPPEFIDRLRVALRREALAKGGDYFGITSHGASCDMLLDREDDVFGEAVTNAKVLTMIEYMCGRNALVSQISGSVRFQGAKAMTVHCDQDWLPAPLPEHNALITACWYTDDIDEAAAGATKVIPKTHRLRRQPNQQESEAQEGAVPLLTAKGGVGLWDGRLWHGTYARELPGDRVLLHATYCRLAYRPLEDYSSVAQSLIERHGEPMAQLLGRNLWFGNRAFNDGGVDMTKYGATWEAARR